MFDDIPLEEHTQKNGWWINELESLGVDTKSNSSELRDKQDNSDLLEAIKQELRKQQKYCKLIYPLLAGMYIRQQAKSNIKRYIDERLPEEYEKCILAISD